MEESKNLIVVDSSVIIKWLTDEKEDLENALLLKDRYLARKVSIRIPLLAHWEINNHLGRNYPPAEAAALYSHFLMIRLPQALLSIEETTRAFEIMKKVPGVSYYDAAFHALAICKKATFVTSDKKYYEKAKSFGNIKLLKDYK